MRIILIVLAFLFVVVFFKSETWITYKETEIRHGIEYVNMRHELQWHRFLNYILEMYYKARESISRR